MSLRRRMLRTAGNHSWPGRHPVSTQAASCVSSLAGTTPQVAPGSGKTVTLTFDDDRKRERA